ncbi:MAG: c-type cytochrome domain-containing protein [Bacteroidota bacterium]
MNKSFKMFCYAWCCMVFFIATSCRHDEIIDENADVQNSSYPLDVAEILVKKCATSGCHDNISKDAAAGLSMITWSDLFKGGNGGAVVIPYRPDQSTLMYYVNHDSLLPVPGLSPTMPVNQPALTIDELNILQNWIAQGAPDRNGFVKFSDNPLRRKYYVANQGCDLVSVFDAASNLVMRAVDVGSTPLTESPHMVRVAYDNLSWFVCFIAGGTFQQYSTLDNTLIGEANIGVASWNTFALTPNDSLAFVVDFSNGKLAIVNIATMTVQIKNGFGNPHGSTMNATGDTLYMTAQLGSSLFKIPVNDMVNYEIIDLKGAFPFLGELEPHDIIFSPDHSKYFVTCQESNEVRVVQTSNDSVIAAIPVGLLPQELSVSFNNPYIFVTCMDAIGSYPSERGSVAIINYETNQLIKSVYTGYQPHGIAVDDVNNKVYVGNRNANPNGPAPHHTSLCAGRNGNVSIIDMSTLTVIPGSSTEVSVDPYSVGITH